eukprot:NODE_28861_length_464_cov_1.584570.p1 GENE.NODE_28861_length_464_cov_1.584570~~NODE_28861_length_464_cov_1.584570.p1  ORF type:complete len:68 (-),score=9.74 NODE_28861_length_464_cov_1.584570:170-373(-)
MTAAAGYALSRWSHLRTRIFCMHRSACRLVGCGPLSSSPGLPSISVMILVFSVTPSGWPSPLPSPRD